jgi:acyl carrier protein
MLKPQLQPQEKPMDEASTPPPPTAWPTLPEDGMLERILEIIAKETGIEREKLVPEATMESLNIASYDMVMVLMEIEDAFNAYVPMGEELADTVYLHDLIQVLVEQMGADPLKKKADQ